MDFSDICLLTTNDTKAVNEISTSYWGDKGFYPDYLLLPIISKGYSYCIKILGDILAFCILDVTPKQSTVYLLAVKKNYTRKGLMKKLFGYTLTNARMSGHKKFILRVAVKNEAAIALYKQFGFQTVSYLKNYYKDFSTNPKENDAYKMELKFSV